MKKIFLTVSICAAVLLSVSCDFLQSMLSSEQNAQIIETAGSASIAGKAWHYNGTSSTDMSGSAQADGAAYQDHSLKIDFGRKAAIDTLMGYVKITYNDDEGLQSTKQFTDLSGFFTSDYTGYCLRMNDMLALFDSKQIPSGKANIEVKLDGFLCAEGVQSGRPIASFSKIIAVEPLYENTAVDYSTCWYTAGETISIPLNAEFTLQDAPSSYNVTSGGYTFGVSAGDKELVFTPAADLHGVTGVTVSLPVYGILPKTAGSAFNQTFEITFVDKAVVIDGRKDTNFSSEYAAAAQDTAGDQGALGYTTGMGDLTGISVVNDDSNLYIGIDGSLGVTWSDGIILMISKDNTGAVYSGYTPADTTSTKNGKPAVYLYHQPGLNNSGAGSYGAYLNGTTDISSSVSLSPAGWTSASVPDFAEYAIPLASAGFSKNDSLKVIAAVTLVWGEGRAVCDALPNAALSTYSSEGKTVVFDFAQAVQYTVR